MEALCLEVKVKVKAGSFPEKQHKHPPPCCHPHGVKDDKLPSHRGPLTPLLPSCPGPSQMERLLALSPGVPGDRSDVLWVSVRPELDLSHRRAALRRPVFSLLQETGPSSA